jgi:hypothetical protein
VTLGAVLVGVGGERLTSLLLRAFCALGIATVAWLAAAATERPLRQRLVLAAALAVVAPPFAHAMRFGNLSPTVAGVALVALALGRRRPVAAAGPLLGLSLALKPVAVAALPLLAAGRGTRAGHDAMRDSRRVAAVAAITAAALTLAAGWRMLPRFLDRHGDPWLSPFQLGFVRSAAELGLALPTWLPALVLALGGTLWLRRRDPDEAVFRVVVPALAVVASPIVWTHTLALAMPVQLRALLGPNAARAGFRRPLELALRGALALAVWGSDKVGAAAAAPAPVRAALGALPLVAVLGLVARCVADDDERPREA